MRFAIGATAALAAAFVRADDTEAEPSSSTAVAKPTFTVCYVHVSERDEDTDRC